MLFASVAFVLHAQIPEATIIKPAGHAATNFRADCASSTPGTFTTSLPISNQSINNAGNSIIYLCENDAVILTHTAGTEDLTGDSDTNTPAGIGYAFYSCAPSVFGNTIMDINNDPCALISPLTNNIYTYTEGSSLNGNAVFTNTGALQNLFGMPAGSPVQLWFSGITFDALDMNGVATYENGAASCAKVNGGPLSVIYLNQININNIVNNGDCSGSFNITGGLPQFDGTNYVNVDIRLQSDPTIIGSTQGAPFTNGETVNFTVTQAGTYIITIEDGRSCGATAMVNITGVCAGLNIDIPDVNAPNGTQVCVPLTVTDFTNIVAAQFTVEWDETVLQLVGVNTFGGGNLPDSTGSINTSQSNNGILTFAWFDISTLGVTLPDGVPLFLVCFNVIGSTGTSSPILIHGNPTAIDVADTNGQIALNINTGSVTVQDPSNNLELTACSTTTNTGSITIDVNDGTAPYTYNWTGPGATSGTGNIGTTGGTANINNLPPGNYNITVTGGGGFNETGNITIASADHIFAQINPFTNPSCANSMDGSMTVNIQGGVPNYMVAWSNGMNNTNTISSLGAGSYSVTVTDAGGCTSVASQNLVAISIQVVNPVIDNASCSGMNDGSITITPSGGVAPYDFNWEGGFNQMNVNSSTYNNIADGIWSVTITDINGCTKIDSFTVSADKIVRFTNIILADPTCFEDLNGSITVTGQTVPANQTTLPYTFAWSNNVPVGMTSPANQNPNSAFGIGEGTYSVTITDGVGCSADTLLMLGRPDSISIDTMQLINPNCNNPNSGIISILAQGGNGMFIYDWGVTGMGATLNNLSADTYTVTITDQNFCSNEFSITLTLPNAPVINGFTNTPIQLLCADDSTATIQVNVTPGNSPITNYAWSNSQSGATLSTIINQPAGTYYVTITDQSGCAVVDSTTLTAPPPLTIDSVRIINPTCFGFANGQITVFNSGGIGGYNYAWSEPGAPSVAILSSIDAGTYSVTITDANSCTSVVNNITLTSPSQINLAFTAVEDASCFSGLCDGVATATATGGPGNTGLYSYAWENNVIDNNITSSTNVGLCSGWNSITVTTGNCGQIDSVFIDTPPALSINNAQTNTIDVSCFGFTDGSATVVAAGGVPQYNYQWGANAGNATTSSISNLPSGTYLVTITDDNGCTLPFSATIGEPQILVASIDAQNTNNVSCFGLTDGQIAVQWTGGNQGIATYIWSDNVSNTSTATNLAAGTYSVTVTDSRGCTDDVQTTISQPTRIQGTLGSILPPQCYGYQTFIKIDTVFGGGGSIFLFSVDGGPAQSVNDSIPIFAGEHIISFLDDNGCTTDTTIIINQPPAIVVNLGEDIEVELGDSVRLNPVIVSSLPLSIILWTPPTELSCDTCLNPYTSPLEDIVYVLQVFDANGCAGTDEIEVLVDKRRNVYIPNVFSPNNDGFNDWFSPFIGVGVTKVNSMNIFDRWGEHIYERKDFVPISAYSEGWDGTFKGKAMDPGVFVYLIEILFDDGVKLLYRGDVTLLR